MTHKPAYAPLRLRAALAVVATLALTSVSACLFEARPADPPGSTGQASVILDAPQKVFVAMETSFEKDNDVDYERALSEGFIFSPLPKDSLDESLRDTGAYDNWTKAVELDVVNLLLSESTLEVTFETRALINENTFVRWEAAYVLLVINPTTPPDTAVYAGTSHIDVRNEGGNWRITYWKDFSEGPGVRTWGFLRGITRDRLTP